MDNDELENQEAQEAQALIPIEQQTITFRDLPLVVVRLPDGRPGVVLRWLCENLHLAPTGQVTSSLLLAYVLLDNNKNIMTPYIWRISNARFQYLSASSGLPASSSSCA